MTELFGFSPAPKAPGPADASGVIKDTTTQNFMADVIDASMEVPVIVDFWAPWCGPCKTLGPMLEKAVKAANGAVRMVKLNIDENPEVPQQMRVQSIPTVYAFKDGRPVDGFQGAVPESQIKQFVERLVKLGGGATGPSPIEEALTVAQQMLAEGDVASAQSIFQQILQHEPGNVPALVGLGRLALAAQDLEDARHIFDAIPAEEAKNAEVVSLKAALELAETAAKAAGGAGDLERRIVADANDHAARLELANLLFASGQREQAIDHLLTSIKLDREWNEQAARVQLLKFFEAMGPLDKLTKDSRRRLSTMLFS